MGDILISIDNLSIKTLEDLAKGRGIHAHLQQLVPRSSISLAIQNFTKANGRLKTASVLKPLSDLPGRLSQRESDFTFPPGGSSEARGGYDSVCRSPKNASPSQTKLLYHGY